MTNYEKIKSMSIDEMAEMLFDESEQNYTYCDNCEYQTLYAPHCSAGSNLERGCINAIKHWLEGEVE